MIRLSLAIYAMASVTLMGAFVLTVLTVPALSAMETRLILPAALLGALLAAPASYFIAAKLYALTQGK